MGRWTPVLFSEVQPFFSMDKSRCINKTETKKAAIVERWPLQVAVSRARYATVHNFVINLRN